MTSNQNLLTPKQLAEHIGVSEGTLAVWRTNKTYPIPYIKIGSLIRYDINEVNKWIETRKRNGGSNVESY